MAKKQEKTIVLSKQQKVDALLKIKDYMADNLDIEIGNLQAEIFLDFITEKVGVYYYNKAISDSLAFMTEKAEDLYLLMKDEN